MSSVFGVLDKADAANGATSPKTGLKGRVRILKLFRERPEITIAELIEGLFNEVSPLITAARGCNLLPRGV